jgi:hypothetical protein
MTSIVFPGTFVTQNVTVTDMHLKMTADVMQGGSIRVGVAGYKGLELADATPFTTDATDKVVVFKGGGNFKELLGREVALEIRLAKATIYTAGFGQ